MTRLAEIETHITSMSELLDIVGAMRSLAGMRMQEAQRALPGIRRYAEAVAAGVADTILLTGEVQRPARMAGPLALVLCTAEHGFVGGFNERLLAAAQERLGPKDALFVIGTRGIALAEERGLPIAWTHPMATRCAGAPEVVQRLSAELYRRIARGEIARVEVAHASGRESGTANIGQRLLLPLDLPSLEARQPRQAPLRNLDPVALHERLMAEYVFALLTEAAIESIASENAARLAAMQSAHDNVAKKLEELRQSARQARQSEITMELLELITAGKALEGGQ